MSASLWYYRIREQEVGPVGFDELKQALQDERLSPRTEVFGPDVPDWTQAWMIDAFELPQLGERPILPGEPGYADDVDPADEPPSGAGDVHPSDFTVPQVRPWIRLWARLLDYGWWFFPATLVFWQFVQGAGTFSVYLLMVPVTLSWCFVEAWFLSTMGTTPGKMLLETRLVDRNGGKPRYTLALNRAVYAWWRGFGVGFHVLILVAGLISMMNLLKTGDVPWDSRLGFRVVHERISTGRTVAAGALSVFLIFMLMFLLGGLVATQTQMAG